MESADEQELPVLMQRYQAGDEDAFTELYRLTSPAIHRYLTRWVDFSKAGDLLQETYLQMHRARRTYRSELPFRPWLYAIARHVAQQSLRTHSRRTAQEVQPEENFEVPVASSEEQLVARDQLETALYELPADQREAIWLAEVEGLTSAEIARITGSSEGAIRVRIHRARQKLKGVLGSSPDVNHG